MEEIILFVESNYQWLTPVVSAFFSALTFLVILLRKGKIDGSDVAKVIAAQKITASAVNFLLNQEVNKDEKTSSEEKSKKI